MHIPKENQFSLTNLQATNELINYLSKALETCDPLNKKIYEFMLQLLSTYEVNAGNVSLANRVTALKSLPEDMQVKLVLDQLEEVKNSLKDINSQLNLNALNYLPLGYIRKILVLECLLKAYSQNTSKDSFKKSQPLFSLAYQILQKDNSSDSKTLVTLFEEYTSSLSVPKDIAAPLKKLILRLQIIGMQPQCQDKTLFKLGFNSFETDTQMENEQALKYLFELQDKLFNSLEPIIAHIKEEYAEMTKLMKDISFPKDDFKSFEIPYNETISNLRYCSYYLKMRSHELRTSCKMALNLSTKIELVLRSKNILNQLSKYSDRVEKCYKKLKDDITHMAVVLEIGLPISTVQKKTHLIQKQVYDLTLLCNAYYTHFLFGSIDEFIDQLQISPRDELNIFKVDYINFIINMIRLYHCGKTQEDQALNDWRIEENLKILLLADSSIPWPEKLARQFFDKMRFGKEEFYDIFLKLHAEFYQQIKWLVIKPFKKRNYSILHLDFLYSLQEAHKKYQPDPLDAQRLPLNNLFNEVKTLVYKDLFSKMRSEASYKEYRQNVIQKNLASLNKNLIKNQLYPTLIMLKSLKKHLQVLKAGLKFTYQFLVPGIETYQTLLAETCTSSEEVTNAWLHSIDLERSKKQQLEQKKDSVKEKEAKKRSLSNRKKNPRATPTPISIRSTSIPKKKSNNASHLKEEAQITPLNLQVHSTGFTPPHNVEMKEIDENGAYAQDQAYHINHCLWTMDLLHNVINENHPEQIALLGANLIDQLYLLQEQGITPLYLAKQGQLRHGLKALSQELNIGYTGENDQGSLWTRYPHACAQYFQEVGIPIPLGLKVVLALSNPTNPEQVIKQITHLTRLTTHGINFLYVLSSIPNVPSLPLKEIETRVNQWNSSIQNILKKEKTEPTKMKINGSCLDEQKMVLNSLIDIHSQNLTYIIENRRDIKPDALKDLLVHIKRLRTSIELFEQFTAQRFLSVHEHNIRTCGQYIPEICFSFISQLDGDEFHTHNFKIAHTILGLNGVLSEKAMNSLKEMNIKKGGDYLYWEFVHNKEINSYIHPGLKNLSEAYELSMVATAYGEGFIPASYPQDTLKQKHSRLVQLISQEIDLLQIFTTYITKKLSSEDKERKEKTA